MSRKRVVLVCMVDSIHVARWLAQFSPRDVEFTLFPSTPNRRVHSLIIELMTRQGNIKIVPFGGRFSIPLWGMDLLLADRARGWLLRRVLKREQPNFVHALELQHGGYIASRALSDSTLQTPFIATNYGSDIFWFQQFPKHLRKLKRLLARANRYSAECNRDVELARRYGFTGEVLPVFPNAGGFTPEQLQRELLPASARRVVAIKGYDGWVGRASLVIAALYSLTNELADYRIVFYSCNLKTIRLAKELKERTGLAVEWHGKGALSHAQMLDLFASARLYVGVSLSDGISTSLLEAMAMGAFPLQTSTACVADWFVDGETGLAIGGPDVEVIATAIRTALAMSETELDSAAEVNRQTIAKKATARASKAVAATFYDLGGQE